MVAHYTRKPNKKKTHKTQHRPNNNTQQITVYYKKTISIICKIP